MGGVQGAAGPKGGQRQPKRPGGQRGVTGARLLQVLRLIVALNVPVEVNGSPAHEDVVDRRPLVDDQAWSKKKEINFKIFVFISIFKTPAPRNIQTNIHLLIHPT